MVHLEIYETQGLNHHSGIDKSDMFTVDLPIWISPDNFRSMFSDYQRIIGKSVLPDILLNVRIIARVAKCESKRYCHYKAIVKYLWHFPHYMFGLDEDIDSLQALYNHVLTLTPPLEKERIMAEKKKIAQQKKKKEEEKKKKEKKRYEALKKKTDRLEKEAAAKFKLDQEKNKALREEEERERLRVEESKRLLEIQKEKEAEMNRKSNESRFGHLKRCQTQYKFAQKKTPVTARASDQKAKNLNELESNV